MFYLGESCIYSPNCRPEHAYGVYGVFGMFDLRESCLYSPNCRPEHEYSASKSGGVYGVLGMFYPEKTVHIPTELQT